MDKLTDSANAVALINTAQKTDGKKSTTADGDCFSKVLEKKTGKSGEIEARTRETISHDKPDKPQEKSRQQAEMEERLKAQLHQKPGNMSMANFLYDIILRNPNTLNTSEKQYFHLGEFSREAIDVKEFQKMLSERGLKLRDLSMTQLAQLTQRSNRAQLTAYLDDLLRKSREDENEKNPIAVAPQTERPEERSTGMRDEAQRKTVEARSGELRQGQTQSAPGDVRVDMARDAERPRSTEQGSRKEEREAVIRQIIDHMQIQSIGRRTELTMKLNPEYLGEMRVKLSTEGGKLEAAFETTSKEVRDFIEEGWEGLRDTFSRKGLNLTRVSATLVEQVA